MTILFIYCNYSTKHIDILFYFKCIVFVKKKEKKKLIPIILWATIIVNWNLIKRKSENFYFVFFFKGKLFQLQNHLNACKYDMKTIQKGLRSIEASWLTVLKRTYYIPQINIKYSNKTLYLKVESEKFCFHLLKINDFRYQSLISLLAFKSVTRNKYETRGIGVSYQSISFWWISLNVVWLKDWNV